jgi:hypothetical protein
MVMWDVDDDVGDGDGDGDNDDGDDDLVHPRAGVMKGSEASALYIEISD